MKYGVIDVGSNSVRLMISDGCRSLFKTVKTTKLAEGMGEMKILTPIAIERTVNAVSFFIERAKIERVDEIFIFATAAVRQARNSVDFVSEVKAKCGFDVDVVSGEEEALLGCLGALNGVDGGVIDVGGASSEIIVSDNGKITFSKSINIGAVKGTDVCGQDRIITEKFVEDNIKEYGKIPNANYYAIGGTATSIASMLQELEVYNPEKVDGFIITRKDLEKLVDKLYLISVDERKKLKGLQPERAEIIACGAMILLKVIEKIGVSQVAVSEKDNLEGYIIKRRGLYE